MSAPSIAIIFVFIVAIGIIVSISILRNNYAKQLRELEMKREETEGRNISEHLAKVKQLNLSGETEELFEKWRKNWDEIIGTNLPNIEESFILAEHYVAKYNFSKLKIQLEIIENMIETVNLHIDEILGEVDQLIGSKKESTAEMESVKLTYRNVKKNLLAHRHLFSLSESKLEEQLDKVKLQIATFNDATDQGNYLLAKGIWKKTKELV
jgi:septation ring formation regulator